MLELSQVHKVYKVGAFGGGRLRAVRDVNLTVEPGEVVSLIGESGSGKSTIGKMVLGLTRPSSGRITFEGTDITTIRGHSARKEYYRRVQGVFQDPFSCFNPIFKADRVFEMIHTSYFPRTSDADWRDKVLDALATVRLDPGNVLGKYPHQLSGGQLQRLLIARALLLDIKLLVADEIISMLDASTRIDVLNLLADLKERGLGILFVTHDLSLGNYVSDKSVILRKGAIAEMGPTARVFDNPLHPYSRHLLSCVPQLHRTWAEVDAELKANPPEDVTLPTAPDEESAPLIEVEENHFVGIDQG
ncbi:MULTISPECIES: ABC transporter ATP-binding protein [Nocardiopsis]|uniref:Oligopeptide ABC transporter ATP-binding protein n=1 Tax=Nocardiopsis sinuspersici TaxID=501010 RepID=A0A1V3C3C8_9ACTN|nr:MULTISPECIES: ABC transporter ATP-binding protein [Nocardiopsis]NYH51616.1 peptide/nickel transport system ATP-binding protein [Nocardiopsis sinuspersici]OOC55235.1 oligopeptide ABC transporter ATP-binding protein [Nocardiopsis sinuspersici]